MALGFPSSHFHPLVLLRVFIWKWLWLCGYEFGVSFPDFFLRRFCLGLRGLGSRWKGEKKQSGHKTMDIDWEEIVGLGSSSSSLNTVGPGN